MFLASCLSACKHTITCDLPSIVLVDVLGKLGKIREHHDGATDDGPGNEGRHGRVERLHDWLTGCVYVCMCMCVCIGIGMCMYEDGL